jgi:amino acid adenylation domain-containing protein
MSAVDLTARLARLSPAQRAQLLDRLRQVPAAGASSLPPLTPRPASSGALPLSFAQQRLWFLGQLDPEDVSYNVCRTLELRGRLDVAALEAALEAVIHRHEALRTTFPSVDGQPIQHIAAPAPLALPLTDLSGHAAAEREAMRQDLVRALAQRPFDLARGPLVRPELLRLEAERHVLVLGLHHIAIDGWSLGVLFDELAAIYGARLRGEAPVLDALPVQYADYSVWERQWLQGAVLDAQLAYWRGQLAGAPPVLALHARRRPVQRSLRGARCAVTLPLPPARALTALAQEEGASPFMALLGAFLVLLYLTTGEDDLVVGTPIAHRTGPQTERLIGYFANTLALRVRLRPGASFRALLRDVRAACLDAYAHQDVPFEKLVEELKPPRSLGHAPFFQLMFQLEDRRFEPRPLPGLDLSLVAEDTGASAYDVTLGLAWRPEGLVADAQYSTDLFEEAEVQRLLEHLGRVVALVAAEPDRPVQEVRLLSAEQRRQVLVDWNTTAKVLSADRPLHVLVAEQAARSPEAPAAICGDEVLSYRQLDARATALAHGLRALGVSPGACVAVCFHRSLEAIVSLLAILKAGAHYLPLDPAQPVERLRWILGHAAPRLVITSGELRGRCEALGVAAVVPGELREAPAGPAPVVDPRELAYVLYTSGSTGRPKGVMVAHHALVARCEGLCAAYQLGAEDRVLHFASLAFDVAAEELFPTWLAGACVVVWPHPQPPPPSELEAFVAQHRVSVVNVPASYWHLWVDALPSATHALPEAVRLVITGSEPVAPERLARWRRLVAPQPVWINAYGPTEATITATVSSSASPGFRPAQVPLSVGRPLARTRVYVLDGQREPTAPSIAGELYLGGEALARGYLGRPDLTAERFLPDPHASAPGARMYRTGDRATLWPGGAVQLLGRADDQIKLRGFRIEPGEIEAALALHPAVRASVVVPQPHPSGEPRLVAYVVCDGPAPTPVELAAWLGPHLPAYMVPALAMRLDALPRTPGGKVDRQALPVPDWRVAEAPEHDTAPTTPLEQVLAEAWAHVLGLDRVGLHDGFFALGGHSLLATQLTARLRDTLQAQLPLRLIFECPTVAQMAQALLRDRALAPRVEAVARLVLHVRALSEEETDTLLAGAPAAQD